jgi:hypothetical protein
MEQSKRSRTKRNSYKNFSVVEMIVQHCFKEKSGNRRVPHKPLKWTPPPPGVILVNVDAALFADQCRMAMGAVFRKNDGSCLVAPSEPLHGFSSLELAEAMALRRAVSITKEKGF